MSSQEERFQKILKQLSENDQQALMAFAEFLLTRSDTIQINLENIEQEIMITPAIPEPENIPRPENENVVVAIKRLSATYPMINKQTMLDKISPLMSQHVLEGREISDVIDDLEAVFRERYEEMIADS
ncbi:MAG: Crp/Fnr family transcriptional regulator [Gammaproteobacteria bacterium]|nr:Crp/Fnr family transcriptional regulator [Gammaproteobacteria bacterium]